MWTNRDEFYWDKLMEWEQQLVSLEKAPADQKPFFSLDSLGQQLPKEVSSRFSEELDQAAGKFAAFVQKPQMTAEAQEQILKTARIFEENIDSISQLRTLTIDQLRYIHSQQAASSRLYSAVQGAFTGIGGVMPVLTDFFAVMMLNVRAVQVTALSYGADIHSPLEQRAALQVAQVALLPDRIKAEGWLHLIEDAEKLTKTNLSSYIYEETSVYQSAWLQEQLPQLLKLTVSMALRKKKTSGLPVLSMMFNSAVNYRTTKKVTDFAERYYQYRYLAEKKSQ